MTTRRPLILQVEDNLADIEYARESCFDAGCRADFQIATDGEKAIQWLRNVRDSAVEKPDLILLDLNLPKVKGHEILVFIKSQPQLSQIPVVVLSGSESSVEKARSLLLGASDHVLKPTGYRETLALIQALGTYIPKPDES